jgi:hypothetical protein
MKSTKDKPLPSKAACPCGSGRQYGICCRKKDIKYFISDKGKVFRQVPLSPELVRMLRQHQKKFTEIFGRRSGKNDLVLFDQFISGFEESGEILERISRRAGVPEEIIFATRRTGFIVSEHSRKTMAEVDLREWSNAIDEYFELKELGYDPFHIFTYLPPAEFDKFKSCENEIPNIIIFGFNSLRRFRPSKQEGALYQFLIACSAFNSYRTIHDMFKNRYDDDCLAILRGIYEQYLRMMALRKKLNW